MEGRTGKMTITVLRWIIAGVFLYAGAIKAFDPAQFAKDVDNYRMLPFAASAAVALYLPWMEIIAGAAFALGIWRSGAALLLGAMLIAFFIALASAWARGLDIACGCFGNSTGKPNQALALLIDAALFAALCVTVRRPK